MSWERGGRYYTRSRRANGRIVREYCGSGDSAHLAAKADLLERERRRGKAESLQAEMAKDEAFAKEFNRFFKLVQLLADGLLLAAGNHQHKGIWRRKRERNRTPKSN